MSEDQNEAQAEKRLIDFPPGGRIEGVFALADKSVRTSKNGSQFLAARLRDCTGERNARWFNLPPDIEAILDGVELVKIVGRVDSSERFRGDIMLDKLETAPSPEDMTPYLTPLPQDHQAHVGRFFDVIKSVHEPHLKALLKELFALDGQVWKQFEIAPAAKGMHHAYRGGLLEHSGEVAILCERAASTLPHLDRDLLVTAALVHDIGKLEEMESGLRSGEYTPVGRLVGHVVLGTYTVTAAAERVPDFPERLKHELMHLILSHHGRVEHGAVKAPMCGEAIVLSLCDLMSARLAQCREEAGNTEDDFPKVFGWESDRVYLGTMRRMLQNGEE